MSEGQFAKGIVSKLIVPESVRVITQCAFKDWNGRKDVEFSKNGKLEKLCRECFSQSGVKQVIFPKSLKLIEAKAFYLCSNLRSMDLWNTSLRTIPENCFAFTGLEEVVLPQSLVAIERHAFSCCHRLRKIILNDGLQIIGQNAFSHSGLTRVCLPPTLTRLEMEAFLGSKDLKLVEFSEGLEEIGPKCFAKTALKKVVLPMSLQGIREGAFYGCQALREVVSEGYRNLKLVEDWAFGDTPLKPKDVCFLDNVHVPRTAFKKNSARK